MTLLKSEKMDLSKKQMDIILNLMSDPIRSFIFIEVLRNPDITPHDLKKRLVLSGSKIYFHLNKLEQHNIIEESASEVLPNHLSRRKFKVTQWFQDVIAYISNNRRPIQSYKFIYLLQLYFSMSLLQQEIRKASVVSDSEISRNFTKSGLITTPMITFMDKTAAEMLKESMNKTFAACASRYVNKDLAEALRECTYGIITGIFPMNENEGTNN